MNLVRIFLNIVHFVTEMELYMLSGVKPDVNSRVLVRSDQGSVGGCFARNPQEAFSLPEG